MTPHQTTAPLHAKWTFLTTTWSSLVTHGFLISWIPIEHLEQTTHFHLNSALDLIHITPY